MSSFPNHDQRTPPALSADQGEVLAEGLMDVAARSVPLTDGLRAAAQEARDPAIAAALCSIADHVQRGDSFSNALLECRPAAPSYLHGLMRVAEGSGRLPLVLAQVIASRRRRREMTARILGALAYPLIVIALTLVVMVLVNGICLQPLRELIEDYGISLSTTSLAMIWWQEHGVWLLAGLGASLFLGLLLARLTLTTHRRHLLLGALPLFGPLVRWAGAAEWAHLLAILLQHGIPLPEALRLTGDGVHNRSFGAVCGPLAASVEGGESLARGLAATPLLPTWLIPMTAWGEKRQRLPQALEQAADDLEALAEQRADLIRLILPGMFMILAFAMIVGMVYAMLLPIVNLLQMLM